MTPIFQPVPSLMLVGIEAEVADECGRAFPSMLLLRVGHAAAAIERMLVTRPLVVLLGSALPRPDADAVAEIARDIRAEVIRAGDVASATLVARLRASILLAEQNRDRPTSP